MTPQEVADRYWALMPSGMRARAVGILRKEVSDDDLSDIRLKAEGHLYEWALPEWHYRTGRHLCTVLRRKVPDSALPLIRCSPMGDEYHQPVKSTWEDFLVQSLECAAGLREERRGGVV